MFAACCILVFEPSVGNLRTSVCAISLHLESGQQAKKAQDCTFAEALLLESWLRCNPPMFVSMLFFLFSRPTPELFFSRPARILDES